MAMGFYSYRRTRSATLSKPTMTTWSVLPDRPRNVKPCLRGLGTMLDNTVIVYLTLPASIKQTGAIPEWMA